MATCRAAAQPRSCAAAYYRDGHVPRSRLLPPPPCPCAMQPLQLSSAQSHLHVAQPPLAVLIASPCGRACLGTCATHVLRRTCLCGPSRACALVARADVVDKTIAGSRILKPGLDAHKAIIVDLVWSEETTKQAASSAPACSPTISAQTVRVADWAPDAALLVKVQSAYRLIDNLRNTQLTVVPPKFRPLTSENARGAVVTMGSYLCSVIRDALNTPTINTSGTAVDGVIIKAGACPRGSRTYADDEHITLEALQMEIQEHKYGTAPPGCY